MYDPDLRVIDMELEELDTWSETAFDQSELSDLDEQSTSLDRPDSPILTEHADCPLTALDGAPAVPFANRVEPFDHLGWGAIDDNLDEPDHSPPLSVSESADWLNDPLEIDDEGLAHSVIAEDDAFRDIAQRFTEYTPTVLFAREELSRGSPWLLEDGTIVPFATFQPNQQRWSEMSDTRLNERTFTKKRRASNVGHMINDTTVKMPRFTDSDSVNEYDSTGYGDLRQDNRHHERFCADDQHHCSCGKRYTRAFRLREHIEAAVTGARHPCLLCQRSFKRIDSLHRHEDNIHRDKKISCPGCRAPFRPDYLRSHLQSRRGASCRQRTKALYRKAEYPLHTSTRLLRSSIAYLAPDSVSSWTTPSESATTIASADPGSETIELIASILGIETQLEETVAHDASTQLELPQSAKEPCSLCGMPLGFSEQYLIDHITKHSNDFITRSNRCNICEIDFAFEQDLEMHIKAAQLGTSCGFFHRRRSDSYNDSGTRSCDHGPHPGHHPPSDTDYVDHKDMQAVLRAWELCQLHIHRIHISRILNSRLQNPAPPRLSLDNSRLSFFADFSRLSLGSIHSFHSVPASWRYRHRIDGTAPLQTVQDEEHKPTQASASVSPHIQTESDATSQSSWESSLAPEINTITTKQPGSSANTHNTFYDQLQAKRASTGMWSKASGVRYRAKAAATRYLLPGVREVEELEQNVCHQYAASAI